MTLGRTSSGAIKLKTDSPGLRAVECACCAVSCGCDTAISGDLLQTMRNATTATNVTCNGASPTSFNASGGGFFAVFEIEEFPDSTLYICALSALTNCFSFYGNNGFTEMRSGPSEGCCPTSLPWPVTCADVTYTINGDDFIAHTENFGFGSDVTPPTFIFS